jgi:hypothetical protein
MKKKIKITQRTTLTITIFVTFFISFSQIIAQNTPRTSGEDIPSPFEESFQEADALAVPWRSSGCHTYFPANEPDCYQVTSKEWFGSHTLTIYDGKGSVWFRFSVSPKRPDHFYEKRKKDFLPFGTGYDQYHPDVVILRLVGESQHWYKVEVNEETQATEYILKADPMWAKTTWSHWLFAGGSIGVDIEKTPLYDEPDGKIIEGPLGGTYVAAMMVKPYGNWAYVSTRGSAKGSYKDFKGWVRWRRGRSVLVKLVFDVTNGLPSTTSGK